MYWWIQIHSDLLLQITLPLPLDLFDSCWASMIFFITSFSSSPSSNCHVTLPFLIFSSPPFASLALSNASFAFPSKRRAPLSKAKGTHLNYIAPPHTELGIWVVGSLFTSLAPLVKSTHFIFPWPRNNSWKSSLDTSSSSPENFNKQPVCSSKSRPCNRNATSLLRGPEPIPVEELKRDRILPFLSLPPVSAVVLCPWTIGGGSVSLQNYMVCFPQNRKTLLVYSLFIFCFCLCFELFSLFCFLCMIVFSGSRTTTLDTKHKILLFFFYSAKSPCCPLHLDALASSFMQIVFN